MLVSDAVSQKSPGRGHIALPGEEGDGDPANSVDKDVSSNCLAKEIHDAIWSVVKHRAQFLAPQ